MTISQIKVRSVLVLATTQEARLTIFWVAVIMDPSGVNPSDVALPQTESPESTRLRQDAAKKPHLGRPYIELLGGRPICGPLVQKLMAQMRRASISTSSKFIIDSLL